MNETYKRIILVSDGTETSDAAELTAINIAKQHSASVLVIDTIRPRAALSKWLTSKYDDHFDEYVTDKQVCIEQVGERIKQAGVAVEVEVLLGKSSEAIVRKAMAEQADLVVCYMKGARSTRVSSRYGTTALNLMRACPCPLLLVGEKAIADPKVLACVDAEHPVRENQVILNAAKKLASNSHHLLAMYCWHYDEVTFRHHFNTDKLHPETPTGQTALNLYQEEARNEYNKIYQRFVEQHDLSSFPGGLHLENGRPQVAIPDICRDEGVDIVVMSSASQNHPLHLLLGSTVESVIEKLPCSLMVVKPVGFVSPVKAKKESSEQLGENGGLKSKQRVTAIKAHVSVFDDLVAAQKTVESLQAAGFALDKIELITKEADVRARGIESNKHRETVDSSIRENAAKWGGVGAAAGSLSIVFAPFPGFVLGAMAVAGITGAIMGAVVGVEHAVHDDSVDLPSLEDYEQLVKRGKCLLVVRGTHQEVSQVEFIIKETHNVQSHILTLHGHAFHEHPTKPNVVPQQTVLPPTL